MSEVLKPKPILLIKLGSLAVHMEEMIEEDFKNLKFDLPAVQNILDDPEVKEWLKQADALALLPKKRQSK